VARWPEERQQELAELALEREAELAGHGYDATADELTAIDERLAVKSGFRRAPAGMRVEYSKIARNRCAFSDMKESDIGRLFVLPSVSKGRSRDRFSRSRRR
jgi:hypothetical protein